jgi:hypothetical protein
MKLPLLQPKHSVRGANPKTHAIHGEAAEIIARERGFTSPIEDQEGNPIEPHQPTLGCKPEIAIRSLRNAVHAALRKSLLGRPRLLAQIPKILRLARTKSTGKKHRADL